MGDFDFTVDTKRLAAYVERNGCKCDGYTPAPLPTGIAVPMPGYVSGSPDGMLEAVDLYCLDALSLLRYLRLNGRASKRAEHVAFALLGWSAADYMQADEALGTVSLAPPPTEPSP